MMKILKFNAIVCLFCTFACSDQEPFGQNQTSQEFSQITVSTVPVTTQDTLSEYPSGTDHGTIDSIGHTPTATPTPLPKPILQTEVTGFQTEVTGFQTEVTGFQTEVTGFQTTGDTGIDFPEDTCETNASLCPVAPTCSINTSPIAGARIGDHKSYKLTAKNEDSIKIFENDVLVFDSSFPQSTDTQEFSSKSPVLTPLNIRAEVTSDVGVGHCNKTVPLIMPTCNAINISFEEIERLTRSSNLRMKSKLSFMPKNISGLRAKMFQKFYVYGIADNTTLRSTSSYNSSGEAFFSFRPFAPSGGTLTNTFTFETEIATSKISCRLNVLWGPNYSPLIFNVGGEEISLSSQKNGVSFDVNNNSSKEKISWPTKSSTGFLVVDKNSNGVIDNGSELFGNHTRLSSGKLAANGFSALRNYDTNHDNIVNHLDKEFHQLLFWQDKNQDGKSSPQELKKLTEVGIVSLKTTFENIIKIDEHGNAYLQKSTLQLRKKNQLKNIDVYDVWFQPLQNDVSKK